MDPEMEKGKRETKRKSDRFFFLWKKETSGKKRTGKKIKGREKGQQGSANVTLLTREKRRWCYMSQRDGPTACRRESEEERHEENRWSLKTEVRKKEWLPSTNEDKT
jgi:hypothetical protein